MRLFLLLALLALGFSVQAQQIPIFSQFREMTGYLNPASIKSDYFILDNNISVGATYRQQWANHPLSPTTFGAHADLLFENRGFSLLGGAYFLKDEVGATDFTGFYGRIGGLIGNPQRGGLSVGFSVGSLQHRVNSAGLSFFEEGDINEGTTYSENAMDVGAGIFYFTINAQKDVFYAGISIPQILGADISLTTLDGKVFNYKREPHYFISAGYMKTIADVGYLEGKVMAKGVNSITPSVDFSFRFIGLFPPSNSGFWVGLGGGSTGVLMGEVGGIFGDLLGADTQLKVGYSPSYYFAGFGPSFGITHEFTLTYLFSTY